jgi:peptidoglycan/xylan/chitin deacetylase (PgdA/CDA1 family)
LVSDEFVAHVRPLYRYCSVAEFERDLEYLLKHFVPIQVEQLLLWIRGEGKLPERAFLLTFDDGLREVAEVVAPILIRKGVPAAVFVNSAFLDNKELFFRFKAALILRRLGKGGVTKGEEEGLRKIFAPYGGFEGDMRRNFRAIPYARRALLEEIAHVLEIDFQQYLRDAKPFMSSDQVSSLQEGGFSVGSHSIDHPDYAELTPEEQIRQTSEDLDALVSRFSLKRRLFAFPFGAKGVGSRFYESAAQTMHIDAIFGTGGWFHDIGRRLVNRISLDGERPPPRAHLTQTLGLDWLRKIGG